MVCELYLNKALFTKLSKLAKGEQLLVGKLGWDLSPGPICTLSFFLFVSQICLTYLFISRPVCIEKCIIISSTYITMFYNPPSFFNFKIDCEHFSMS